MFNFFKKEPPEVIRAKYHIPAKIKLSVDITSDGWFVVSSPELPGLLTQAQTAKELLEMVNDAILTYYDVPKREVKEIYNRITIDGYGVILNQKTERVLATK